MLASAWGPLTRVPTAIAFLAAAAVGWAETIGPAAAQGKPPILERKFNYAPWNPADLPKVREKFGLIGPGTTAPYPKPIFPRGLVKPDNIERLMPNARAVVRQTGGRSPLGLTIPGDVVLIVALYNAEPMVQEAIVRA
jgi:hypothetical protein